MVRDFVLDEQPNAITAAAALCDILEGDPSCGNLSAIPIFRDPSRGHKITYKDSRRALKKHFRYAEYPNLTLSPHILRIRVRNRVRQLVGGSKDGGRAHGCPGIGGPEALHIGSLAPVCFGGSGNWARIWSPIIR